MQEFNIIRGSVNPSLEMELIDEGRYGFQKSYIIDNVLQDSVVTFNMVNEETGLLQVAKAPAEVVNANTESCEEKYILRYKWKPRDVAKPGYYKAWFEIKFNGNISEEGVEYPTGNLKVPVEEDLRIVIK